MFLLKRVFLFYLNNFAPDVLGLRDKLVVIVHIIVNHNQRPFSVLKVILLGPVPDKWHAESLDERDDLLVGGGLLAHGVGLVLVGRPEDLGHKHRHGFQWDL